MEWKAQWIGAPWDGEEFDSGTVIPAPQFRKVFEAPERIKSATAYVTGLGFFEFYVNGSKAGGGRETIVSDSSWEVCRSPILLNDLFEGEVYDARFESDAVWEPAAVRKAPDGRLLPQDGPADRVVEVLKPKNIRQLDDGRWEDQGAQTTWEQWNGEGSHNHPMFGGALVWLYRKICGVQTDETEPGYRHIIIRPTPAGDLTWAEYSTETPYGKLSVRWDKKRSGRFRLKVRVPSGSHATVFLPDGSGPIEIGPGRTKISC